MNDDSGSHEASGPGNGHDARGDDGRGPDHLSDRLEHVEREIGHLKADLAAHRAELAAELSTRRVVIRAPDGFARIVLTAHDTSGHVIVSTRSPEPVTGAELFASDHSGDSGAHVGLALTAAGDIVAMLELLAGEGPMLWLDDDGETRRRP